MPFNRSVIVVSVVIVLALGAYMLRPQPQPGGSGPPMVSVVVPELSETAQIGKGLFDVHCATCHGKNAAGQNGVAPPLIHKIYEPNHHSDVSFQRAAKFGVRSHHWTFGNMPPVTGVSEDDVRQIIGYVRELQRANGIL